MTKTYKGSFVRVTDMTEQEFILSVNFILSLWGVKRTDFSVKCEEPFKPEIKFHTDAYDAFVDFENTTLANIR
jgi:hypothetical protein